MILTWRAGLLAALAVVAVAVAGTWPAALIATGVLVLVIALDLLLGASPATVGVRRGGDTLVRLGEEAHTDLTLTNLGRRDLACTVRVAWTPSAGARGGVQRVRIPARQRRRLDLTLRPTRRGDRRAGPVVVRALGPLGVAGRQAPGKGAGHPRAA